MNRFLFLAVFLFLTISDSLAQSVFRLDSLPANGVVLDKGWRWHAGDNPDWARADFDDARWDTLNPIQDIASLHQLPQQGIGWLRIHLRVAPLLREKAVGLFLRQAGATQLFLNGKLILQSGQIDAQKRVEVGSISQINPFILLDTDSVQVLTIRYSFSKYPALTKAFSYPFFNLRLMPAEVAEGREAKLQFGSIMDFVLSGIFLVLGLLQLVLYRTSTKQQTALSLGLFLLFQGLFHLISGMFEWPGSTYKVFGIANVLLTNDASYIVGFAAFAMSIFYYLLGIYQYFERPRKTLFFIAAASSLAPIPAVLLGGSFYILLFQYVVGVIVPFSDILRIGVQAVNRRKPGAMLFTLVHGFTLLVYIIWTVSEFLPAVSGFLANNAVYLSSISFLLLALTITLLLAQERVTLNKVLRKQLDELEALSVKTIAQEQEKQQLLATQNERLEQQVSVRTAELNQSLTELKTTQTQLIQKEKLASLGELTAGIAHEIQNPLNFVNNFSEVSTELVSELEEEQQKPDRAPELEAEILGDLKQNLQKIHHHGKRASSIVKGMLEHSRISTGERQPTDLNALADEYLRLAYQGMRAKYKTFNCELVSDFAPNLALADVVSQDIGRVLLNLFTNAFYAVQQRAKGMEHGVDYQPTVWVSTHREPGQVVVLVKDNGTGIPDAVKDKIFQPFFTTKPTGEGTGLGLSLSYDIVTKGHGGTLLVKSTEGEGTEFTIVLPNPTA